MKLKKQRGIGSIVVLALLGFLSVFIPITTKLVQKNQDNRSNVSTNCKCSKSAYGDPLNCSRNGGRWSCINQISNKNKCVEGSKRCASRYLREKCIGGKWIKEDCRIFNPKGRMECTSGGWCQLTKKPTPTPTKKPTPTSTKKPTPTPTKKPTKTPTTVFFKDFEDGLMGGWVLNNQSFGKFEIANIGYNSQKSLMIESNQGYNKMDATYKINNLKPFSYYTLNVYIKTEGITTKDGVIAASVVVRPWYVNKTEEKNGDWRLYSMEFLSNESGEIDISCALGLYWYAGGVMGRAYFDNIQLIENFREVALSEGKHINLFLKKDYIKDIPNNTLTKLVSRLDSVYENYSDLVGFTPYQNKKIIIAPLLMNLHIGAAFAGNPISWITDSMKERLNQVNNNDDWCYILLHEISHDFDIDVWNFDAEVLAQIKTIYAVEKMNARIMPGDSYNYYVGSDVSQHYKYVYDDYNKRGFYFNEYMTYVLLKIKDNIGWDAFKQAFRNLNTLNVYVESASERLNLFLNELSKASNKDVKGMISNSDKKIIESQFGKVF